MADVPLYRELMKLAEEKLEDEEIYEQLTQIFERFCPGSTKIDSAMYDGENSKLVAYNAESFRDWLPILVRWINAAEQGAILPTEGGWPGLERVHGEQTGNSLLRPTKDGVLFYKRFASSANYFELKPECEFCYGFEYAHAVKGRKGRIIKLKLEPKVLFTEDGIPDYAYSLISFAFYRLLVKHSRSGTSFYLKTCATCGRGFYCTKRNATYCSVQCEDTQRKRRTPTKQARPRRIPGVERTVSESDYRAWCRERHRLGKKPSEEWNRRWFASRNL